MNVSMRPEGIALMRACASKHHEAGTGIRQRLCALVRRNIRRLASLLRRATAFRAPENNRLAGGGEFEFARVEGASTAT